jgi:hygromycin-B 7''-O-kinase
VLDEDPDTMVHGDLHLENVLTGTGGQLTGLVDFEWASAGSPDLDLDILLHSFADPSLHVEGGPSGKLERRDFDEVVGWLRGAYPELFAHPRLAQRLWLYRLAYEVRSLLRQPPPVGIAPSTLPVHHPYQRVLRLLDDRSELGWFLG